MEIIPAIDLIDGGCVRLRQGDYAQQTRYEVNPVDLALRYAEAGARRLHVVDLEGARGGRFTSLSTLEHLVAIDGLQVQCGGGVRSESDLRLLLDNGVDRAVLGSLAIMEPDAVASWLKHYGGERLVLALDVRQVDGEWRPAVSGWTETSAHSLWTVLDDFASRGLRHLLCTDIGSDGMLGGPRLDLYEELVQRYPGLAVQASGGISSLEEVRRVRETGAAGAIIGRALLDGRFGISEALAC